MPATLPNLAPNDAFSGQTDTEWKVSEAVYVQLTLVLLKDNQDFDQRMMMVGRTRRSSGAIGPPRSARTY